jgi:hypothetical protein
MEKAQDRTRVPLARSLGVLLGLGGGALFALVLLVSGRAAAAADLPATSPLQAVTLTTEVAGGALQGMTPPVLTGPISSALSTSAAAIDGVVTSGPAGPLTGGLPAAALPDGANVPVVAPVPVPVPALPVPSTAGSPASIGVVHQGAPATATTPSPPMSAPALGVAVRTGSAALLSGTPPIVFPRPVTEVPAVPAPVPSRRPLLPPPFATFGAAASPVSHPGPLDSIPPAVLVLAALVGVLMGPWRQLRPKLRLEPRFSPPG